MQMKWAVLLVGFVVIIGAGYFLFTSPAIIPSPPTNSDAGAENPNVPAQSSATSTSLTLGVGKSGTFKGLTITFNKLVQDSRCAIDVECIQAGAVNTNVTFSSAGHTETKN